MNEVKRCSISGISFSMEQDAYATLKEYIETLKRTYGEQPDGNEIIADIETRIAELILSTQDNGRVVQYPLIANIIAQLGSAADISEESAIDDDEMRPHGEPRIPRRLYRDMENAGLGGVCAGLAKYFNVDVTWVRLACFSPLMLGVISWIPFMGWVDRMAWSLCWIILLSYLVMWFAVPAARTARQKLEADGEKITVQRINEMTGSSRNSDVDNAARPVIAETVTLFGRLLILLMKIFGAFIFFIFTVLALGLIIGLFVLIFACGEIFGDMGSLGDTLAAINNGSLVAILGVLAALIPTILLLFVLGSLLIGSKPNRTALLILFILWIITLIVLPVTAIKSNRGTLRMGYSYNRSEKYEDHERLRDSIDRAAEEYSLPETEEVIPEATPDSTLTSIDLD